jgi:outer membrane receptor protein involved in Fe transport
MRSIFITLFFLHGTLMLFAQDVGSVKGAIKQANNPVEYANVFLTLKNDSTKIISGTVSDSLGNFALLKIPFEHYVLHIQVIGFVSKQIDVSINNFTKDINLNSLLLEPDALLLNSIEVVALRELIQKTDEGFIVKASENITQIGGTAADLLKNMPGVLVSADGGVTLRGKTPLTLINGRISGIAGTDRSAQLEQIPASSIDRIEIINNPSAKYDADSEGGIINIILKKNEDQGTNGAFAIGAGYGDRYRLNISALANHKTNKWNIGGAYDNWYTTRTRSVKGDRINFDLPDHYYLTQRRFDERLVFYQNAKSTVDFTPNKKNTFSVEALWAFPGEDNNETLKNTYENSARDFTSSNQRHSNEIRRSNTVEVSLKYIKHFDNPDKLLTANVSNTFNRDNEETDITTIGLTEQGESLGTSSLQRTHVYQKTNLANMSVDYLQPISSHSIIETGYKGIIRFLNSDYERAAQENGEFVIDPLNTNVFEFNEQIHAGYLQYSGWKGDKEEPKMKYNIGLRAEQVWNKGETADKIESFKNDYFNLFPSGSLSYYTSNRNNFRVSYSRRITRPSFGQLNPFTDITDSLNQRSGNPKLNPELINSWELSYNTTLKKGSFSLATFYRIRNNAILPYTVLDENGVAFTQPQNFGNAMTYGAEVITSYNPFSFWSLNFSFSAFKIQIEESGGSTEVSKNLVSWYTKLVNNFTLYKNGKLQVIGNYTSPTAIPQGESIAVYFVDGGFQHRMLKGKGRLGVVLTDIFNTQRSGFITSDNNFKFSRIFKLDTRAIMATFGYTFGTSFKEKVMENRFRND